MATTFEFVITPDASLNIAPMNFTIPLANPEDFMALVGAYNDILQVGNSVDPVTNQPVYTPPTPSDTMKAIVSWLMMEVMTNVLRWVQAQKAASVVASAPVLTITTGT